MNTAVPFSQFRSLYVPTVYRVGGT